MPRVINILFFLTLIYGCDNTTSDISHRPQESCFCDSLYDNTHSDTVKEYLCYRGDYVYKHRLQNGNVTFSRHSLSNPNYLFELLKISDKGMLLPDSEQYFISVNDNTDEVSILFKYKSLDSFRVTIENRKGLVFSQTNTGNKMTLKKKLLADTSHYMRFYGFTHGQMRHPETNELGQVRTSHTIHNWGSALLHNTHDSIFRRVDDCIKNRQ